MFEFLNSPLLGPTLPNPNARGTTIMAKPAPTIAEQRKNFVGCCAACEDRAFETSVNGLSEKVAVIVLVVVDLNVEV